ncbi:ribonuclease H-like domain-containing protein [Aspergillus egyptiacus]|nr:ribonuclease H-like domain-containing protein [Aspergillus egyptiacus]
MAESSSTPEGNVPDSPSNPLPQIDNLQIHGDSDGPDIKIVDSRTTLLPLLENLESVSTQYPVFLDLKGVNLGREGSISILSLALPSIRLTYLVDILTMRESAFNTETIRGNSLRKLLESPEVIKIFFDVRMQSDALFNLYSISLQGIRDLQLMELATREGSKERLSSLTACMQQHSSLSVDNKAEWRSQKQVSEHLYDPNEFLNRGLLSRRAQLYCAGDVLSLVDLFAVYEKKLISSWREKVRQETEKRIKDSQREDFKGRTEERSLGPWGNDVVERDIPHYDFDEDELRNWDSSDLDCTATMQ